MDEMNVKPGLSLAKLDGTFEIFQRIMLQFLILALFGFGA